MSRRRASFAQVSTLIAFLALLLFGVLMLRGDPAKIVAVGFGGYPGIHEELRLAQHPGHDSRRNG